MITIFSARTVQKCHNYFVHLVFCQAALWINNTDKIKNWTQQPPITWRKTAYSISYTALPWLTKATNALTTFLNKNWAKRPTKNGAQKYTRIRNFKTSNRCCWIGKLLLVLWYYNAEIQSEIWSGLRQNINNDINLTNCYSFRGTL